MTTVRDDFVMVTKDNKFVTMHLVSTMIGYRPEFGTTTDIDTASTILHSNAFYAARRELDSRYPGWRKLPVKVIHTVELVTEELDFNLKPEKE